ncbi:type IV pilus secretin PilQ [Pseudomarimonas salicorniae]|uniref:Type IV pilus secretin PilQ n=1 Tax=Pseudomarimonas salicorniae TaxID=2933270 RepID=A0ABT0GJM0_9GAMM|nr:type IV pilus secretin PilQ [Lysobacter sp. CAU 1642]MCK7594557.1 type IV pilus secretin PilQ [Lysobacter sp. CAU 1642]
MNDKRRWRSMNSMQLGEKTMTPTNSSNRGHRRARLAFSGVLLAIGGLLAAPAWSANKLRDVQFTAGPAGAVEIILQLDGPATDATVFTTEEPPRIAVDLPDTLNEVATRRIAVGSGATSSITTLEANGKTRVVVDLFQAATYQSRVEGNRFFLTVSGGAQSTAAAIARVSAQTDPAKRIAGANEVENIDFRRGEGGAGRVILTLSAENVVTDFEDTGEAISVQFSGTEVPDSLAQRLDVTDFATPVQTVELRRGRGGASLMVKASGDYESMAYQSGTDYVIEVVPVAAEEQTAAEIGIAAEEESYSGVPVTFNFQNIPVRTVLQLIAEESGLNMVAADSVSGNVTLRLINVPWDQALDIVLRAKGLDKRRDGNVIWVAPQSELAAYEQARADARLALEQRAELVTEYIPINYGNAQDIASLLTDDAKQGQGGGGAQGQDQRGFLSPRGSVSFDRRTNTLLLNDNAEKIREIKALIALLDRAVDQVLIEARIVVASESFARELGARFGVSGGYEDNNGNVLTTSGSLNSADRMSNLALRNRFAGQGSGLPVAAPGPVGGGIGTPGIGDRLNVNLPVVNPSGTIGFALLGADYLLDLELSALETEGRGEVVSSPRVITANQREAIIRQGDEVGYVTISPQAGGNTIPIPNVQFKEVLLELTVTPTITQDGRVSMVMRVVKDEIADFVDTSIGLVPQITKREISTQVLMDNAQTVVIGGVYEFSSREDLNKVPFLGDIPALGNLFKRKGRNTEKAELLIFVTPRVLAVKR